MCTNGCFSAIFLSLLKKRSWFFSFWLKIFFVIIEKNCRNEVSTDYFSTLKRETMQAYCVSKTEWTLVEWMACGSRLCCCTAPTYITHFIGFVAFSPSLAHFSHITSIKWDLVFLSYNLLSLPLCHSLSFFPIYISLSLPKGFQMKFSICRSLSFSFTARLCRQPDHTEIKNTKCVFFSFSTSIYSHLYHLLSPIF